VWIKGCPGYEIHFPFPWRAFSVIAIIVFHAALIFRRFFGAESLLGIPVADLPPPVRANDTACGAVEVRADSSSVNFLGFVMDRLSLSPSVCMSRRLAQKEINSLWTEHLAARSCELQSFKIAFSLAIRHINQMPKTPKKAKRTPNAAFMKPVTPDESLAKVVGDKPLPRTELTKKLWVYIKKNGLQDAKKKTLINADENLKAVFDGKKQVSMFEMTKLVSGHLKK
jgi:hypothetical protein